MARLCHVGHPLRAAHPRGRRTPASRRPAGSRPPAHSASGKPAPPGQPVVLSARNRRSLVGASPASWPASSPPTPPPLRSNRPRGSPREDLTPRLVAPRPPPLPPVGRATTQRPRGRIGHGRRPWRRRRARRTRRARAAAAAVHATAPAGRAACTAATQCVRGSCGQRIGQPRRDGGGPPRMAYEAAYSRAPVQPAWERGGRVLAAGGPELPHGRGGGCARRRWSAGRRGWHRRSRWLRRESGERRVHTAALGRRSPAAACGSRRPPLQRAAARVTTDGHCLWVREPQQARGLPPKGRSPRRGVRTNCSVMAVNAGVAEICRY